MNIDAGNTEEYIMRVPEDRRDAFSALLVAVRNSIPAGSEETMLYGMVSFVVPKSAYPEGYHVRPGEPLPFISLASQKNHLALYHMALALFPGTDAWFRAEYERLTGKKPDIGKACIRFRPSGRIPYGLVGELCGSISMEDYIARYDALAKAGGPRRRKR